MGAIHILSLTDLDEVQMMPANPCENFYMTYKSKRYISDYTDGFYVNTYVTQKYVLPKPKKPI